MQGSKATNHGINGLSIQGAVSDEAARLVLNKDALQFVVDLERRFGARRAELLQRRLVRAQELRAGKMPDFLPETEEIRRSNWQVGSTPADLQDRKVEITGPAEAKMAINALNSGAKAFMADFEDALSPTWANVINGQIAMQQAVRRTLTHVAGGGKRYELGTKLATLLVRPRGWHLSEKHLLLDGQPMSGSLVDFGLYFFHNAKETLARGSGPYFYLPKLESHLEARLWNDVFTHAQSQLGLSQGSIKATVLIETILAAFEMDEILYELREHCVGLNAGRWDYIFSIIKKFGDDKSRIMPDRSAVTMAVPFMRAYSNLLVKTCHRRGAHAMGGMAAFVPSRRDEEVNRVAIAKVKEDKIREAEAGFDGTWVAHPDLVPVALAVFDSVLSGKPHQKDKQRPDVQVKAEQLTNLQIQDAGITEAGVANNINVAVQYLYHWLNGTGAVALHNLMEDAATAEISRAQLWQWLRHGANMVGGRKVDKALYLDLRARELERLGPDYEAAARLLDDLVFAHEFPEFLTLPAYQKLEG